jgi:hypothetical protein
MSYRPAGIDRVEPFESNACITQDTLHMGESLPGNSEVDDIDPQVISVQVASGR